MMVKKLREARRKKQIHTREKVRRRHMRELILRKVYARKLVKGKLGVQIYFRKIPLHQQEFLVFSILFNSPWLLRSFKKCPK